MSTTEAQYQKVPSSGMPLGALGDVGMGVPVWHLGLEASLLGSLVIGELFVAWVDILPFLWCVGLGVAAFFFPPASRALLDVIWGSLAAVVFIDDATDFFGVVTLLASIALVPSACYVLVTAVKAQGAQGAERWLPRQNALTEKCGQGGACCCRWFSCSLISILALVAVVFTGMLAATNSVCSAESFQAQDVLTKALSEQPVMELGTADNMQDLPFDFSGVWWIHFQFDPIPFFRQYHLEELVSFKGLEKKNWTQKGYKHTLTIPAGLSGHWSFGDTIAGRVFMLMLYGKEPEQYRTFHFENLTHAFVPGGGGDTVWYMHKVNDDRWLRTIVRPGLETWTYDLDRIIREDGTPTEHWQDWVTSMGRVKLRKWSSNSECLRVCGSKPFASCSRCQADCDAAAESDDVTE